jgi:predicted AlkP superfamily pyrophosphatase or phosphodiesterase
MRLKPFGIALALTAVVPLVTFTSAAHDDDNHDRSRHAPRVILISLDGARPDVIKEYLRRGVLDWNTGLGRLVRHGVVADRNVTVTPSLTAVSHIAIATGSTATHNDIPANTFHAVVTPIGSSISGFGAPIGGYRISPLGPAPIPTAEPLWVQLRSGGRQVVTATWPGGDGVDVRLSGAIVQPASPTRVTDYTVPFGAFGGVGAQGFTLTGANFTDAPAALVSQIAATGRHSFSPERVTTAPIETLYCAPDLASTCGTTNASGRTLRYDVAVAALDSTDDHHVNYDVLVFFDTNVGVPAGPFMLPSTGAAFVRAGGRSGRFFFEGSGNKVGTAFFVNTIASDLSFVKFARYSANVIPRNAPVLDDVDDVNEHVGFWAPQSDFRIPERLSPGFGAFSDQELEAIYEDQVKTFVRYQTRLGQRAIRKNPDADLVMIYIEQPDGSGHQFTLTDPRQATNPLDPTTIGVPAPGAVGQDLAKVSRYARYLEVAYRAASEAVEELITTAGVGRNGEPQSDVFVVSDHGMAPFHTAVQLSTLLSNAGVNLSQIGIRTTGPAVNVYVNLAGRESGGTVPSASYQAVVDAVAAALRQAKDPNPYYSPSGKLLFTDVWTRPSACGQPGFCTDDNIGQDTGDVLALMDEGYNFDGTQSPAVFRLGDPTTANPFSVPNFYGAHGHNSDLRSMSATFIAAGPNIRNGGALRRVRNVDVAPTILDILGFSPRPTVDGRSLTEILRRSW